MLKDTAHSPHSVPTHNLGIMSTKESLKYIVPWLAFVPIFDRGMLSSSRIARISKQTTTTTTKYSAPVVLKIFTAMFLAQALK